LLHGKSPFPKDLILQETNLPLSGSKKTGAGQCGESYIDQNHTIRFVQDVLRAAQKDSPGNGEKALRRRCE